MVGAGYRCARWLVHRSWYRVSWNRRLCSPSEIRYFLEDGQLHKVTTPRLESRPPTQPGITNPKAQERKVPWLQIIPIILSLLVFFIGSGYSINNSVNRPILACTQLENYDLG